MIEACQELKQESGTMETVIQVQVRNVYGNALIYPVNQAAQLIANIAGTRTLSRANLAAAQQLGFQVQEVPALQLQGAAA